MSKDETPGVGHNSSHAVAADKLRAFCERIERVEEEMKASREDKKEIFAEAKGQGYDLPALREILKRRKADKDKQAEFDALVDTYATALGMGNVFA